MEDRRAAYRDAAFCIISMSKKTKNQIFVDIYLLMKYMLTEAKLSRLRNIVNMKEQLTDEQKRKLLIGLKKLKEEYTGNTGGETDITNPDNLVSEEIPTERNVIAKTFDTKSDFDSYVNQHRGIEFTPKEQQSIINYKNSKPTQHDKYFVKYETTDDFGTNDTTVIKKLKEGGQFCWTAFAKHERADEEAEPEGNVAEQETSEDELTVNDPIRITKSVTFINDVDGANVLSDFLIKLDL